MVSFGDPVDDVVVRRNLKMLLKRKRRSQRSLWTTSRQPPWISDSRPQTKQSTVTPATTSSRNVLLRRGTTLRNAKSTPDTTDHYVLVNGLTSGTKRGRMETTLVVTEGGACDILNSCAALGVDGCASVPTHGFYFLAT